MKIDRREFLRKAGLGSITLASLPTFVNALADPASADSGRREFFFVAFSQGAVVGGVSHRIAMQGAGRFNPEGGVAGGGNFVHFDDAPPPPKPLIAFGKWRARRLVSYTAGFGTYGRIEASVLEMLADLILESGPTVRDVTLRLICNLGVLGISTGQPEGFRLSGVPFGPFVPLVPALGLTSISIPVNA